MARALASASSQYMANAAAALTATPLTLACWGKPTNFTGTNVVLGIFDSTVTNRRFELLTVITTGIVRATHSDQTTTGAASTSVAATSGSWNHMCGVFTSTSSRTAYVNGGSSGTDTTSVTGSMASINRTTVGRRDTSSQNSYFNGSVAEVGIWNVALSATDVAALAAGVCPLLVRPDALVFYAPLMGVASPEPDFKGRFDLTLNNTPTASVHPRIYYAASVLERGVAAAAASGVPRQAMHQFRQRRAG